jgi:predicted permease
MPEWKPEIRQRLASLKLEPTREAAIVEELAQHIDDCYAELLAGGATEDQAYGEALAELNESERLPQEMRQVERPVRHEPVVLGAGRADMLNDIWQDLRYGLRALRKNPGFTAVATLTLALGIGANTAIFSVIDALMLKRLPVRRPDQLVRFEGHYVNVVNGMPNPRTSPTFPHPTFEKFRALTQVFSDVSGITEIDRSNVTINGPGGGLDGGQVVVGMASGNYFSNLGVQAVIGRTFTPDDDRALGGHPVAVISYGYWERRFARVADVVGRTLTLSGVTYDVIGVTPKGFSGDWVGKPMDLWVPFMMASQVMPEVPGGPSRFPARVIGRLKPGATREQAQAAAQVLHQQILLEGAGPNPAPGLLNHIASWRVELAPAANGYSPQRRSFAQPLAILMIVVGLLMLIACANVANLLLARASGRHREMAVRLALGAGRWRVIRQLLTESALLAASGGALGLLFAWWGTSALAAFARSGPVMSALLSTTTDLDLRPDERVFAFTAILCLGAALLFGLAPALRSSKVSLASALTGRGEGSDKAGGRFGPGRALVIAQVALSLLLLVGAGLFARTLSNLKAQDLGFDQEHTLLVWMAPVQTGRHGPALAELCQTVQERLSSLPGALSASVSMGGVLDGGEGGLPSEQITIQGQAPRPGLLLSGVSVAPEFFKTVGIPLLQGRDFTERDNETSPRVAVINETMSRFFFGDQDPIGRRFGWMPGAESEIVGVVKDAKTGAPRDNRGVIYSPYRQYQRALRLNWSVAVRAAGDPTALAAGVRQELRNIDPRLPVLRINTIKQQLDDVLFKERLVATLSALFGLLAFLLASLGLYGVVSYTVASRANEIGIRLALGATPAGAFRMIFKESLALALAGVAIGVPVTLATTRLISSRLFGVRAIDPFTIAAAASLLLAVAAIAALIPARRAARVDPMAALRSE